MAKILLIRMDKIGDLVLTLGVDQHPGIKDQEVFWLIAKGNEFIIKASKPTRKYKAWTKQYSRQNYKELVQWLKKESFDIALFFQGNKWIIKALSKAKIPTRIGNLSSIHSYLYLNKHIPQRRSKSTKSEFILNQELLEKGLHLEKNIVLKPTVLSAKIGLEKHLRAGTYFVVHAGMGGSALNWKQSNYVELIEHIRKIKKVVLTGTKSDSAYLNEITEKFKANDDVLNFVGKLNNQKLLSVLAGAITVIAPSTGILHLAASLGVKTVGIFSPIHVQSANRWGAYSSKAINIQPLVNCPMRHKCMGAKCEFYNCMDSLTVNTILRSI